MKGFFHEEEIKKPERAHKKIPNLAGEKPRVSKVNRKTPQTGLVIENACEICGIYRTVHSPQMGINGGGRLGILYLAESQGSNEDAAGRQLVGDAGSLLRTSLGNIGLDLDRDFYTLNAVRCFTWKEGKNGKVSRNPTDQEIRYCWKSTWDLIKELQPKAIWTAGLVPLQSYLLDKGQDRPTMARWRGWAIPDQTLQSWIIPHYHPSYIMRNQYDKALRNIFEKDLCNALIRSDQPFFVNQADNYLKFLSVEEAKSACRRLLMEKSEFLEIDFETTGLKPHREGHDITHIGFAPYDNEAWAFPFPDDAELRELVKQVLLDPDIALGAHNTQMEQLWASIILNARIPDSKWAWDSIIGAHHRDNREGITSLEFQAAVRYGDFHFKHATEPFLKCPGTVTEHGVAHKTGGNDFNRIRQCPEEEILKRVAKDALYGRWLSFDQMEEIQTMEQPMQRGRAIADGYWLFHDGTLAMGDTKTDGGLLFDKPYFEEKQNELSTEISQLEQQILESPPAIRYKEIITKGKDLNPGSDTQLRKLLFDIYRIKPTAYTETGQGQVNNEMLLSLSSDPVLGDFSKNVLRYNQLVKLKSTYIEGFKREAVSFTGHSSYDPNCLSRLLVIYPHLGLNYVQTYRSSSSNPNFQNIPNRDEFAMNLIRSGLYPHPGHRFVSVDFGSHEFVIAANYSQDREMIRYIMEGGDPHGDQAERIFLLTKEQRTKQIRYIGKNGWVFPQQYGQGAAYKDKAGNWKGCAPNMWNMALSRTTADGTPLLEHLASKGIKNLNQFAEHCQAEEKIYWKKFSGLKAWQEEWLARYERDGVVPMYHGFLAQGLLSKNKVLNYSIQGTGFHFLLESFIELNRIRKEEEWQSKIIGQIHDEIKFSAHPEEFAYLIRLVHWVMVDLMSERHGEFLRVPLKAEFKAGEVDAPWAQEKGIDHSYLLAA